MTEKEEVDFNLGEEAEDIEIEDVEFEPKQKGEWLDFTDLPLNQIYLSNSKDILEKPRPTWIPEINNINDKFHPFIPTAIKDKDGNYRIFDRDEKDKERFYIVTPDLLAITADYYKKKKDAELKRDYQKRFSECKEKVFKVLKNVFPDEETWKNYNENENTRLSIDGKIQDCTLDLNIEGLGHDFVTYTKLYYDFIKKHLIPNSYSEKQKTALEFSDLSNEENFDKKFKKAFEKFDCYGFGKVPSARWHTGKRTMHGVRFRQMNELCKKLSIEKSRSDIFYELEDERTDIAQKILDLNYQKIDYLGRFTKGRETSYGDSNLNSALKNEFGVNIKRQDGTEFTQKQLSNMRELLKKMYSHYGDLSKEFEDSGYKISYAADVNQHASKNAIGIYFPFYKAIGVSVFADDVESASCTFAHEIAHYLDGKRGDELNRYFASDDENSLEYKIADSFRKHLNNKKLKGYWKRTCECFARALEQYYAVEKSIYKNPESNPYFKNEAYCSFNNYNKYIKPLVSEYMKEHSKRFGFENLENEIKSEKGEAVEEKEIKNLDEKITSKILNDLQTNWIKQKEATIVNPNGVEISNDFIRLGIKENDTFKEVLEKFETFGEDAKLYFKNIGIEIEKNPIEVAVEKTISELDVSVKDALEEALSQMGAVPETQKSKSYEERLRDGELTETEKEVRQKTALLKLSNLIETDEEFKEKYYSDSKDYDSRVAKEVIGKIQDSIEKNDEKTISSIIDFIPSKDAYKPLKTLRQNLVRDIDRREYLNFISELEKKENPTAELSKFIEIVKSDEYVQKENSWSHPEMNISFIKDVVELLDKNDEEVKKEINDFEILSKDGSNYNDYSGNPDFKGKDSRSFGSKEQYYHWALNMFHYGKLNEKVSNLEISKKVEFLRKEFYKDEPFVFDVNSESSIFKEADYSLKEFNEILTKEDKTARNLKDKFFKEYGKDGDFYELKRLGKLGEEYKKLDSLGYDKTDFVICVPDKNSEDNTIYTPTRYDISDGDGSVFDFVRKTCSHPEIIELMDKVEDELYFPENSVNYLQKAKIQEVVKKSADFYHLYFEENINNAEKMQKSNQRIFEFAERHKEVQDLLSKSKNDFEQFVKDVVNELGENWIYPLSEIIPNKKENPKMTGLMKEDVIQKYIAKEIRKSYINEVYNNNHKWTDAKRNINSCVSFVNIEDFVKETVNQYINLREIAREDEIKREKAAKSPKGYLEKEESFENKNEKSQNPIKTDDKTSLFKKQILDLLNSEDFSIENAKTKIDSILNSLSEKENNIEKVGVRIVFDKKSGNPNLKFSEKPSEKLRDELRESNWLWSSLNKVWWPKSKDKEESLKFAKDFVEKYGSKIPSRVEEVIPTKQEEITESFKTQMNDLLYQGMSFDNSFKAVLSINNSEFSDTIKEVLEKQNLKTQKEIENFIKNENPKIQKTLETKKAEKKFFTSKKFSYEGRDK